MKAIGCASSKTVSRGSGEQETAGEQVNGRLTPSLSSHLFSCSIALLLYSFAWTAKKSGRRDLDP
jgi:hypothetical protein